MSAIGQQFRKTFGKLISVAHKNGKDTLACKMPKEYNITKHFSDSCDHKNIFVSPSYHKTVVEPCISI